MNIADFVRTAVREKIEAVKVIEIRDNVSFSQAKKEILDYLSKKENSYASDVSEDLKLDLDLVFSVLKELKREGKIE